MPILKFPLDVPQSMGRFWLSGADPDQARSDGNCRVEGRSIDIEVVSPLTEWMSPANPKIVDGDLVIHGMLAVQPGPVTFLGARTITRAGLLVPSSGDTSEFHGLRAEWCVTGAHIDGLETQFTAVRARFTHLELWARTNVIQLKQRLKPSLQSTMIFTPIEAIEVPFQSFEEDGRLRVTTDGSIGPPGPWGSHINTRDWLELDRLSGWTLEEALARFVRPIQILLTLLAGEDCSVTHLEVKVNDQWCAVYGDAVQSTAPLPENEKLLMDREAMPLEKLAVWCEVANRLAPTPHVVGSSVGSEFATLDAEALALTTTAEGLDRVLYPDSRRFDEGQVAASIKALKASEVPDQVREAIVAALNQYFYEDTYPVRMKRLADSVAEAVPRCVGKTSKWKGEIANLRIGLAHALDQNAGSTDAEIWTMHARVRSLRWAILLRLLLEAGVPAKTLSAAVEASRRFQRDERIWRTRLPKVFPISDDAPAEANSPTEPAHGATTQP
ncbi:hypothetical protein ACFT2C_12605 [Promicromonospora sp. NPDC057138]|uniref:ApeA N-terminal domain 1-containing protein n=1 Tax=Promicromonospora sp. NPDC057138 TaxID=3346031 RepID=UPI003631BD28